MVQSGETFFTVLGCMDGRCQEAVAEYGRTKFGARYADTITETGLVGVLANNPSEAFLQSLKKKIFISLEKHHSKGILIDGHAECAGDPVDDATHMDHVRSAIYVIKALIPDSTPIAGVFVHRCPEDAKTWEVSEVIATMSA